MVECHEAYVCLERRYRLLIVGYSQFVVRCQLFSRLTDECLNNALCIGNVCNKLFICLVVDCG